MVISLQLAHISIRYETQINMRRLAKSNQGSHFFHNRFGAHVKILSNIKEKIPMLIKCSYRSLPSQLCSLLNLDKLSYFEHMVQSLSRG